MIGAVNGDLNKWGYVDVNSIEGRKTYTRNVTVSAISGNTTGSDTTLVVDTAGNELISILQPYLTVYFWQKIAD